MCKISVISFPTQVDLSRGIAKLDNFCERCEIITSGVVKTVFQLWSSDRIRKVLLKKRTDSAEVVN